MRPSSNAVVVLLAMLCSLGQISGQGCTDTCPPLDDTGKEIPSLCVDSKVPESYLQKSYDTCHPSPADVPSTPSSFTLDDLAADEDTVIVMANHYIGCNAGRRESGVFAHVAQKYHDMYNTKKNKIVFVTSLKGGSACENWASIYQNDAVRLFPDSTVKPTEMPWTVSDENYVMRDDFFTTPFGHPSYVILATSRLGQDEKGGGGMVVRDKFVGPCCGFIRYSDCQPETARQLDGMLSTAIDSIMQEMADMPLSGEPETETETTIQPEPEPEPEDVKECIVGEFSEWSPCSIDCGTTDGMQFRWRTVVDNRPALATEATVTDEGEAIVGPEAAQRESCPSPVEVRACRPDGEDNILLAPSSIDGSTLDAARSSLCLPVCIPEFNDAEVVEVATGFDSPRDVAFHPTPGLHLGERSEGRKFNPNVGDEAWVANGANHSVSIVAALGTEFQTDFSRRDRGYYHYMINATALSFNMVSNSGRDAQKDAFEYFAVCNDNNNDYMKSKEVRYPRRM